MKGSLKKQGTYWYAIVDITDNDGNRKRKWINTKCDKKPEAEKVLRKILQEIDNNTFISPSKLTLLTFMSDWIENTAKNKIEYTTWQSYKLIYEAHILRYFKEKGDIKLSELKPLHLQMYFEYMYNEGRSDKKGGLSASTLRKHFACLSGALEYATQMELIPNNPIRKISLPKKIKFTGNYYTADQIEKLLEVVLGTPIETAVYLAVSLGLRRAEVLGLKFEHIDWDEQIIKIQETRVKFHKDEITKEPKNDSSKRILPLSDNLFEYLKLLKKRYKKNKEQFGEEFHNTSYLVCWDNGLPLTTDYLNHKFKAILKQNNMPHIRFHDLRHSTASYLLKQGLSMKEISVWLGHGDIGTTMNIYAHLDIDMKKNAANILNNISKPKLSDDEEE